MAAILKIDEIRTVFHSRKGKICCSEARELLESLGFDVKDGRKGGHKVYVHAGLPTFKSGSYNCGHGKDPEIKAPYITKIINNLDTYKNELVDYLESQDG